MDFLIRFASENEDFQSILRRSAEYSTVQGVVVDIDRSWISLLNFRARWGDKRFNANAWHYFEEIFYRTSRTHLMGQELVSAPLGVPAPITDRDLHSWRPDVWKHLNQIRGMPSDMSPIVVKVCVRPRISPEEQYPRVEDFENTGTRIRVEIDHRSRARLCSDPRTLQSPVPGGVSIGVGASDYGTLGVILNDGNGVFYGLTCSHVAGHPNDINHPARRDLRTSPLIGSTVFSAELTSCPPGIKCNPWTGVSPNEIDASVFQVNPNAVASIQEVLDIGPLYGIAPRSSLSPHQAVQIMARTSRHNKLQIGGLAAWYSFIHNNNEYCFKNLFEVESPYGSAGLIKIGDSGAPVCSDDATGTAWAGMIIGCDAYKGFAIYSETIDDWMRDMGYNLSVN